MISRKNTIENDEEEMLIPEEFLGSQAHLHHQLTLYLLIYLAYIY